MIHVLRDDPDFIPELDFVMDQYHPGEDAHFNTAALPRTLVYKLTVEEMTAKRKELKK